MEFNKADEVTHEVEEEVHAPLMSQDPEEEDDDDYEVRGDEVHNEGKYEDVEELSGTVVPTSDSPYMVIHHGREESKQTFYSISKGMYSVRSVPAMHGTTCYASYRGWLVMLDNSCSFNNRFCFLLNSASMEQIKLPMINSTSYECDQCILTASPPDCVVMFLSFNDNSCLFCRPNDKKWTRNSLGPKKEKSYCPGDCSICISNCFQVLLGAVTCQGKIYINYRHGDGMQILDFKIDHDDSRIENCLTVEKIKFHERLRDFGSDRFISDSQTSIYLVESCGEVFLVERIYIGSSSSNIYSFSVYKLTSTTSNKLGGRNIAWKKVESLGDDRVFFVAESCSMSVSASKAGLVENHIYFFHPHNATYLYRFNMDTGSIYKTQSFPHLVAPCRNEPYWMISNSIL